MTGAAGTAIILATATITATVMIAVTATAMTATTVPATIARTAIAMIAPATTAPATTGPHTGTSFRTDQPAAAFNAIAGLSFPLRALQAQRILAISRRP